MLRLKRLFFHFCFFTGALVLTQCASTGQMGTVFTGFMVKLETDTRPHQIFNDHKIGSISIMNFDAKSVKTMRGEIIDYVNLGNKFTDDLIRAFYENGKIRVITGEYIESVEIHDKVLKQIGDQNIKQTEINRTVTYKAAPFRKVDAVLSGRIEKFTGKGSFNESFVEIYFSLTDTYDGSVYWITPMRGTVGNVINTMVETISLGNYTEIIEDKAAEEINDNNEN